MSKKETAPKDRNATVWAIEPHTSAKHAILRHYLNAWFPVLSSWSKRVVFIDGFAGPGSYAGGEPGSPELALRTLLDHGHATRMKETQFVFIFNEFNTERHAELEAHVDKLSVEHKGWPKNVVVKVHNDNFKTVAEQILTSLGDDRMAPTFAFVDPFGYKDVPLELIARLMKYKQSELFIYWDANSANRFATGNIVDEHFEALFGTDEFKNAPPAGDANRMPFLHDLYRRQLAAQCGFRYVRSFQMVNSGNRTGNYLFFGTRSLKGLDKMKYAMWQVDPTGNFRFSDMLNNQAVLFDVTPDFTVLEDALLLEFSGQTVDIDDVVTYVIEFTPFHAGHVKMKTLKPMQAAGRISSPNQKRAGQFPPGTLIAFP
ncbi:three-Cys-motif partner protein TcmP [Agreia bicolorata]|uniref:Three-Cys-motif partner protein n=1 Tax=Agreia bicolorata TaxID=110935 RepID=A0ABR5CFU1_9MICO|nr:three-Cys-motif partner protein TcmP [Agreia bicolorata]KJC64482.1 hypothetical protein TZ00_08745 [Agreia bicolorata]